MESQMYLLPLAASICLLTALLQAWLMTMVRYFDAVFVKKLFPNYRDLVRSHIDYLMMTALVFSLYLVLINLEIQLPSFVLWLVFVGSLYNPFGFVLQAIKPDIVDGGGIVAKVGVVFGFLPLTIGLIWSAVEILLVSVDKL